jgi:hypothetical protein
VSACRSCHAPITWAVTEHGRSMPLDAKPVDLNELTSVAGLFALRDLGDEQVAIAATPDQLPGEPLYRSHFATCPHADQHRRSR